MAPTVTYRGILAALQENRPWPDSTVTISYDASPIPGPTTPNLLFGVDNGKSEPHQDEYRLIGETVSVGTLSPPPGTPMQIIARPDGNGVTVTYTGGPSRHIQWLSPFGEEVARLWKGSLTPNGLNTLLPALTEAKPATSYRQAVLTLLHLDKHQPVTTTYNIAKLQHQIEKEPEIGDVIVAVAAGNQQPTTLEDILRVARTVIAP